MEIKLNSKFLVGVSSAATQIEGGEVDNNWLQLWKEGGIKDGSSPAVADMHWEKWKEDINLMAEMGIEISRFGIEWARIVPEEGKVNHSAIEQYRSEIQLMIKHGIRPLLTIHHFSNPMWFEKKGGWVKRENLKYFLDFVKLTVNSFGDLVNEYVTINEPNVYAVNSFMFGEWYPRHKSFTETVSVMENMAYCHIKAYTMIHSMRRAKGYGDTKVGFANHLRPFDPKNPKNPLDVSCTKFGEWVFQDALTVAMTLGEFKLPLVNHWGIKKGEYADYNGINYYTRSTVSGLVNGVRENSPRNDLDWEIYPEGLIRVASKLTGLLLRPIWVTENGTCDNEDRFRERYLYEHFKEMAQSPLPFERYYHWCFCDNWEWSEGQIPRFGIVKVDYKTQKRTIKKSGKFYSELIKNKGITSKMYDKYVKDESYDVR